MTWQEYESESEPYVARSHFRFGPKLTPTVKALILINVVVFLVQLIAGSRFFFYLCVVPALVIRKFYLWQLVTYMFLHGGVFHIFFNMFALWMFGSELETRLGRERFLQLYFVSGVGAGLCHTVASWGSHIPMLGASGAVFGILVAFAMLFPDRYITLFIFLFPLTLKAKHLVLGFAAIEALWVISASSSGVAHVAHLGGLLFGYLFMKSRYRLALPFAFAQRLSDNIKRRWHWRKPARYKYKPIDADEFISEEVDPILAKISREGVGSLTRKEKKVLKKARSQMK